MVIPSSLRKNLLILTIILSVIGLLTSLYLVKNHYAPATSASFCDLSVSVSCSLVNTSTFSVFLGVPVAVFGALWFVVLAALAWRALRKDGAFIFGLLVWNVVGILSVVYLIIAEIILQALCPFCTVVHAIIVITLIFSIILYKRTPKISVEKALRELRTWIIAVFLITIIIFILFNISSKQQEDHTVLAQCLTEKGVVMYGSSRCAVCAKTRALFGPAFQYVTEIECYPGQENSQTELCLSQKIAGTPTWVMEQEGIEQKRQQGFLSIEELQTFSGCEE
ncbi:vitamin K epoxide reductase family protein [Candidatus Woesearchaeota archaeon]|nr:vitamin K epoxide reductase family protein [Candidatus Woesearchaeota archaeon]